VDSNDVDAVAKKSRGVHPSAAPVERIPHQSDGATTRGTNSLGVKGPQLVSARDGRFGIEDIDSTVRLETGHEWQPSSSDHGLGDLNVTNGTRKDGVAVLYESLADGNVRPRRAVYVRAGEAAHLQTIAAGGYRLRFMLGVDWSEDTRSFRLDLECHAFVDALEFTETQTADGIVYDKQSVTLHKVIQGNARSATISPTMVRFDELVRRQQP
jgi:hypothetical protein